MRRTSIALSGVRTCTAPSISSQPHPQRLVQFAPRHKDVRNLALGHRLRAHVTQFFIHRQLFFRPDPQRFVKPAPRHQDVRPETGGQRGFPLVTSTLIEGPLGIGRDEGRLEIARAECCQPLSPP